MKISVLTVCYNAAEGLKKTLDSVSQQDYPNLEYVGINQAAICAMGADITIGNHTLLGGGVKIYSFDFHSLNYLDRKDYKVADRANRKYAPVKIGEDCFICAGTIIQKGVTIGDRTIIGAGSVVTKGIPADCIAGGNPVRVIKKYNKD